MAEKDDYKIQRARIERLVKQLLPTASINWDEERVPAYIRLRVDDPVTGTILIVSSGDWHVSEIADKTDAQLVELLKSWSGGKL